MSSSSHLTQSSRRRVARSRRNKLHVLEPLEQRALLSSVPFGATFRDNGEFMLGSVLVSLVLFESDGTIDANQENWTATQIAEAKQKVTEGVQWWSEVLARQDSVHHLDFHFDFQFADAPIATGYEPITRTSDSYSLWVDDFFAEVDVSPNTTFSERIFEFNHQQRVAHNTNWAFTIFMVNDAHDADGRFDTDGTFDHAFAFSGGRAFVVPAGRPVSTIAHETGHMFWAADEYLNGKPYDFRRGYYNAQNSDGLRDNPNPNFQTLSIMESPAVGFPIYATSPSSMEIIGWRDSDGDGIFDVLDVDHSLVGEGYFNDETQQYVFDGVARVQTLENLNSSGTGNDMTINTIDALQVKFGDGDWATIETFGEYQVDLSLSIDVPAGSETITLRAIDYSNGVTSNLFSDQFETANPIWQNTVDPVDVNQDGSLTALDALLVINEINSVRGIRELTANEVGIPLIDVNADRWLTALDALLVINELNKRNSLSNSLAARPAEPALSELEGEPASRSRLVKDLTFDELNDEPDSVAVSSIDRLMANEYWDATQMLSNEFSPLRVSDPVHGDPIEGPAIRQRLAIKARRRHEPIVPSSRSVEVFRACGAYHDDESFGFTGKN